MIANKKDEPYKENYELPLDAMYDSLVSATVIWIIYFNEGYK